jgi:hypothetical protein
MVLSLAFFHFLESTIYSIRALLLIAIRGYPLFLDLDMFRVDSVLFEASIQWCRNLSCRHQGIFGTRS